MNGKSKCKILKQIRKEIAKQNDIEYVTSECKFQGECTGTCPKCESEVRYLEQELSKRRAAGKTVAVVGIAASLLAGCTSHLPAQTIPPSTDTPSRTETTERIEFDGVPPIKETVEIGEVPYEETEETLMGDPVDATEDTTEEEMLLGYLDTIPTDEVLEGDVPYVEDGWEN